MPAKTEKQRKFMGAELQRKREGKQTRTGTSEDELEKMASKGTKKKGQGVAGTTRPSSAFLPRSPDTPIGPGAATAEEASERGSSPTPCQSVVRRPGGRNRDE